MNQHNLHFSLRILLDSNLNIDKSQSTLRREYQPTSLQFLQAHPKWNPRIPKNHLNPTGTVEVLRTNWKTTGFFFKSRLPEDQKIFFKKKRVDKLPHDIYIGCSGHSSLLLPGRCQADVSFNIFWPIIWLSLKNWLSTNVCVTEKSILMNRFRLIYPLPLTNWQLFGALFPTQKPSEAFVDHGIVLGNSVYITPFFLAICISCQCIRWNAGFHTGTTYSRNRQNTTGK